MKILITGSNGLLGQKIVRQLLKSGVQFLATSLGENRNSKCPTENYRSMDITDPDDINSVVDAFQPSAIINTAAMTNVDACEDNEDLCRQINVTAVKHLLAAAKKQKAFLTHLSTDFVFDGENGPYSEEDERNPLSIYAQSKADSEDILMNADYKAWAILRTIIVFGQGENMSRSNIVLWAKSALAEGKPLSIVNDQFRAPTWADDLAWACIQAAKTKTTGLFHISGPETFSIFELVSRVAKFHGHNLDNIAEVSSTTLNQKAKRPPKTGFDISKARKLLGYNPMSFEESLKRLQEGV